jgi:hypothetical protein
MPVLGHEVEAGSAGADPALTGTDNEVLVQALRNLWPLLGKPGRATALGIVQTIQKGTNEAR